MITPFPSQPTGRHNFVTKNTNLQTPGDFTAAKVCWSIWWTITNNCSDKYGWYCVLVWWSLENCIQTNWSNLLRYFLLSFVQVIILSIAGYGADYTWILNWMVCFFVCDIYCWACFTGFRLYLSLPFLSTFGLFLTNLWWQAYINQVIYSIFWMFLKVFFELMQSSLYSATATVCEHILYDLNLRHWPSQLCFPFLLYITVCGEEGFEADATIKLLGDSVYPGLVLILSVE